MYSSSTNSTFLKAKFKIVVVGDKGVGKTSFLLKFLKGTFSNYFDELLSSGLLIEKQLSKQTKKLPK